MFRSKVTGNTILVAARTMEAEIGSAMKKEKALVDTACRYAANSVAKKNKDEAIKHVTKVFPNKRNYMILSEIAKQIPVLNQNSEVISKGELSIPIQQTLRVFCCGADLFKIDSLTKFKTSTLKTILNKELPSYSDIKLLEGPIVNYIKETAPTEEWITYMMRNEVTVFARDENAVRTMFPELKPEIREFVDPSPPPSIPKPEVQPVSTTGIKSSSNPISQTSISKQTIPRANSSQVPPKVTVPPPVEHQSLFTPAEMPLPSEKWQLIAADIVTALS